MTDKKTKGDKDHIYIAGKPQINTHFLGIDLLNEEHLSFGGANWLQNSRCLYCDYNQEKLRK